MNELEYLAATHASSGGNAAVSDTILELIGDELIAAVATLNVVEEYSDEEGRISQYWYDMARNSIDGLKAAIRAAMPKDDPHA